MGWKKILTVLSLVLGFAATNMIYAAGTEQVPANVVVDQAKKFQAAVNFAHKLHVDKGLLTNKCDQCHLKQTGLGGLKVELLQVPENMAEGMKHAWHKVCLDCHKISGNAMAPKGCKSCHK